MRKLNLLAGASLFAIAACTATQVNTALADVQNGCIVALTASNQAGTVAKGGAANTVADINNNYLVPACATEAAVAKLAADPTSVAWLNQQAGALQAIAATATP